LRMEEYIDRYYPNTKKKREVLKAMQQVFFEKLTCPQERTPNVICGTWRILKFLGVENCPFKYDVNCLAHKYLPSVGCPVYGILIRAYEHEKKVKKWETNLVRRKSRRL